MLLCASPWKLTEAGSGRAFIVAGLVGHPPPDQPASRPRFRSLDERPLHHEASWASCDHDAPVETREWTVSVETLLLVSALERSRRSGRFFGRPFSLSAS